MKGLYGQPNFLTNFDDEEQEQEQDGKKGKLATKKRLRMGKIA